MTMLILKSNEAPSGSPVWIMVDKIVTIGVDHEGDTAIATLDGRTTYLKEKPEEVLATLKRLTSP